MGKALVVPAGKPVGASPQDLTSWHTALVAAYTEYLEAAGHSIEPYRLAQRLGGAWGFLRRFPDPASWLAQSLPEQRRLSEQQRAFLHYLFLRRLLPMPAGYILAAHHHLGQVARLLIERDTYAEYEGVAQRLGYTGASIQRQFHTLVSAMAWAQRTLGTLTTQDLDDFAQALRDAGLTRQATERNSLPAGWVMTLVQVREVLTHLGVLPRTPSRQRHTRAERWAGIPPQIQATVHRYLDQVILVFQPSSTDRVEGMLRRFFVWLSQSAPSVVAVPQLQRHHIEAYKEHLRWKPPHPRFHHPRQSGLAASTIWNILSTLRTFFARITEWGWSEGPSRPLIFDGDFPPPPQPLPRFLEDAEATRFLQAGHDHPELFTQVCGVTLLRTGLRSGEFLALTADCVVEIGGSHWLRVPIGKMRRDRYIPLHQEVKTLLDRWSAHRQPEHPTDFLFIRYGRPIRYGSVQRAVADIARRAGIPRHVTPHQLRHTLATLAINRGMALEQIAALLGHRSLSMTLVYARIGQRTLQEEYQAVSQQLEHLCGQTDLPMPAEHLTLPETAEGPQMQHLRHEIHWRLLGNGYCTRPEAVPCHYETICEGCPCFTSTPAFLPMLLAQKADAETKGEAYRVGVLDRAISRVKTLSSSCSAAPAISPLTEPVEGVPSSASTLTGNPARARREVKGRQSRGEAFTLDSPRAKATISPGSGRASLP